MDKSPISCRYIMSIRRNMEGYLSFRGVRVCKPFAYRLYWLWGPFPQISGIIPVWQSTTTLQWLGDFSLYFLKSEGFCLYITETKHQLRRVPIPAAVGTFAWSQLTCHYEGNRETAAERRLEEWRCPLEPVHMNDIRKCVQRQLQQRTTWQILSTNYYQQPFTVVSSFNTTKRNIE